MFKSDRPTLTAVQLLPWLVERYTPSPNVPARRLIPFATRVRTSEFVKPPLTAVQLLPSLVER